MCEPACCVWVCESVYVWISVMYISGIVINKKKAVCSLDTREQANKRQQLRVQKVHIP